MKIINEIESISREDKANKTWKCSDMNIETLNT